MVSLFADIYRTGRDVTNSRAERVEGENYKSGWGQYGFSAPFAKANPVTV